MPRLPCGLACRRADQHGLGLEDRLAEDLHAGGLEGVAGLDDVGDGIRDAEPHGGFDGAVQPDHVRPLMPRSAR